MSPSEALENTATRGLPMLFALHDVTKTYGRIVALRQLSVTAPTGAVGLLGPNGAGKTTLIRTILGLISVDSGYGEILGMDVRKRRLDIRQAAGFVPEDECLFPGVSGIKFVAYAGALCGMARTDALQRSHEVLNYVGLGEARYRNAESYSTGMKQRLKLAAAIVHDPRLLIMDEPTNGMDPAGRQEMLELARDLAHNKGMSLIFSSHLLPDVEYVCDHAIVLGGGRLLAQGQIQELKELHDRAHEIRVKTDPSGFARRLQEAGCGVVTNEVSLIVQLAPGQSQQILWETASAAGEQIRHLRPQRSTLEEVFLRALDEGATNGTVKRPS
jgi:ABC-2 type transport system ATP-binding protein